MRNHHTSRRRLLRRLARSAWALRALAESRAYDARRDALLASIRASVPDVVRGTHDAAQGTACACARCEGAQDRQDLAALKARIAWSGEVTYYASLAGSLGSRAALAAYRAAHPRRERHLPPGWVEADSARSALARDRSIGAPIDALVGSYRGVQLWLLAGRNGVASTRTHVAYRTRSTGPLPTPEIRTYPARYRFRSGDRTIPVRADLHVAWQCRAQVQRHAADVERRRIDREIARLEQRLERALEREALASVRAAVGCASDRAVEHAARAALAASTSAHRQILAIALAAPSRIREARDLALARLVDDLRRSVEPQIGSGSDRAVEQRESLGRELVRTDRVRRARVARDLGITDPAQAHAPVYDPAYARIAERDATRQIADAHDRRLYGLGRRLLWRDGQRWLD